MRYITAEEFYGHLPKEMVATLTESKTGEPDMEIVEHVNDDAADLVDSYLRGIYRLPLDPAPRLIKSITADIMKVRLFERRDARNMPEALSRLYKTAIDRLKDIQARRITLDVPAIGDEDSTGGGGVIKQWTPSRLFGSHFTRLLD